MKALGDGRERKGREKEEEENEEEEKEEDRKRTEKGTRKGSRQPLHCREGRLDSRSARQALLPGLASQLDNHSR